MPVHTFVFQPGTKALNRGRIQAHGPSLFETPKVRQISAREYDARWSSITWNFISSASQNKAFFWLYRSMLLTLSSSRKRLISSFCGFRRPLHGKASALSGFAVVTHCLTAASGTPSTLVTRLADYPSCNRSFTWPSFNSRS